jgi:hypothetical protein
MGQGRRRGKDLRGGGQQTGARPVKGERPECARNQLRALKEAHQPSAFTE